MPIVYDLFCGLGGWSEGFLAEGYECIGFDIEAHEYWVPENPESLDGSKGTRPVAKRGITQGCAVSLGLEGPTARPCTKLLKYPGKLILRDIRSIHGSELKDATVIVASPPCQAYSYRAMPWKRAKALPPPDNTLFHECFRIQREAIEAAGHHIPMIVENVRGAQPWVGRARWNYGSFYLWGDVPALMPMTLRAAKVSGFRFDGSGKSFQTASVDHVKVGNASGRTFSERRSLAAENPELDPHNFWHGSLPDGTKQDGDWFGKNCESSMSRLYGSKSPKRKMASAMIAKIPEPLSRHIARTYYPKENADYGG